jgi:hypothetical protein
MTKPCYDVGYGKPPLHTRFRKGQSGNPKGRGKGTKNFATIFVKAMSQPVTINENGKRKKISKLAAAIDPVLQHQIECAACSQYPAGRARP